MYNLLKNLMIMRSLSAVAAVFMVTLLAPHSLLAADIPWAPGGGVDKIKVTGDCTWEWVGDELVIKWLSGSGTMELPQKVQMRALVVGGGVSRGGFCLGGYVVLFGHFLFLRAVGCGPHTD